MERRVAIYCRVSTQQQTTDRQRAELEKFAFENQWVVEDGNIFVDVISGFKKGEVRPCYSNMVEQIECGNIDTVLFSEFSRLARNATDLLNEVTFFREHKVELFFQKQNLWIKHDCSDLGSTIMLHVLAVMSSFEIELFAERSLSGKITKVQNGNGGGDERAYGYINDVSKKIVINPDEAAVVRRAFEMYVNNYSSIQICEVFNSENIPSPYINRIIQYVKNREEKGLKAKQYKMNVEYLKWRPSSLNRILHNELYVGKRNIVYNKPDPTNPTPIHKRRDREVVFEYSDNVETLRIVSDELFQRAQSKLGEAHYNKNNAVKHDNLLKHLMRCGECGGNFSVGKCSDTTKNYASGERTYKCYGRVNRKDKPQTCQKGAEVRQWKMDGLVLQLSIQMFAQIDIENSNNQRIEKLTIDIAEKNKIMLSKRTLLQNAEDDYRKVLKRLARIDDDDIAEKLIIEEKSKFDNAKIQLDNEISKLSKEIVVNQVMIKNLERLNSNPLLSKRIEEIREDSELVSVMINEFVEHIDVYRLHKFWLLVIVHYKGGEEMWGTIKSARYKKDEMLYDPLLCKYGIEFQAWLLNNIEGCFSYNAEKQTIHYDGKSDIYNEFQEGVYDYVSFDTMVKKTGWIGSFPFYDFEKESEQRVIPETLDLKKATGGNNVNWKKHNDMVFERLQRK